MTADALAAATRGSGIESDPGALYDAGRGARAAVMRGLIAAVFALSASVSGSTVADDATPDCRALRLGDPAAAIPVCAAAAERALAGARVDEAEELLFQLVDAQLATGAWDATGATLDRVAALPASAGDGKRAFRLQRRRGILAYRTDRFAEALQAFRETLDLAVRLEDEVGADQARNDLGNALRRIGDYRGALEAYRASLEGKRRRADPQVGPLLNNLGDLHRDLGDLDAAARYYQDALAAHLAAGRPLEAAHTQESIAAVAFAKGDAAGARSALESALAIYTTAGAEPGRLRALAELARQAREGGDLAAASAWLARGPGGDRAGTAPLPFVLESARTAIAGGETAIAERLLVDSLARLGPDDVDRIEVERALAELHERAGDAAAALAAWRRFHRAETRRSEHEHDRVLGQLRVQFEVAEKDRAIEALRAQRAIQDAQLRQRTLQLWATFAAAVAVLALMALVWQRHRQRSRIELARREAARAAEVAEYRRAAEALAADSGRLRRLLDANLEPILAVDRDGRVVQANAAAARVVGVDAGAIVGRPVGEVLGSSAAVALDALGRIDDDEWPADLDLGTIGPAAVALRARVQATAEGDLAILILIQDPRSPQPAANADEVATGLDDAAEQHAAADHERFRAALVELMLAVVEAWERSTRTTRIELAERSRLWRVTIDDGRLRVRAMERYLALPKLPRQPRWREVLRTAYFVLAECELDPATASALRGRCDAINQWVRDRARLPIAVARRAAS